MERSIEGDLILWELDYEGESLAVESLAVGDEHLIGWLCDLLPMQNQERKGSETITRYGHIKITVEWEA